GRRLLPVLVKAVHKVIGMTRSEDKRGLVQEMGAEHVAADALDHQAVLRAITQTEPDVVVHEMTAIPRDLNLRKFDQQFALTNRLRSEGTDNLLQAALAVGARRFVVQSYAGWPYARIGGPVKTEEDPLDPNPPAVFRTSLAAIQHIETTVPQSSQIHGIVLRYGSFYGPGTSGAWMLDQIRKRRLPVIGNGGAVWSFIHIDDVATATLAAVEGGHPGIYNIVDDEPELVSVWLPELARMVHAKPPMHVPEWIARLAVGEAGVIMMTEARGSSNQKAKNNLKWTPHWKSWRDGFRHEVNSIERPLAA
ncbi:MAG TPA: NAD(P)-dependent oxidoreductase, partial [Candidatus Sulfotelmatobacter sp.]|nr:NAD(P)-dependent oxidoreductase [Candidatus Sulfotelmatobacter sp.]